MDLSFLQDFNNLIVMETGGMKGRREEWIRDRVHDFLKSSMGLQHIGSEYGMTELFSQAYAARYGLSPRDSLRAARGTGYQD